MMRMERTGAPLVPADLIEIESRTSGRLPRSYTAFLLDNNGGWPVPCSFGVSEHDESPFDVHYFFGVAREFESSNVGWHLDQYPWLLEQGFVPIAGTDTGDLILISIGGDKAGSVWFWDSMAEVGSPRAILFVSDTFDEFVTSLYEGNQDVEGDPGSRLED